MLQGQDWTLDDLLAEALVALEPWANVYAQTIPSLLSLDGTKPIPPAEKVAFRHQKAVVTWGDMGRATALYHTARRQLARRAKERGE